MNKSNDIHILIDQSSLIELISDNLFSDKTQEVFDSCEFASDRMAFMQGMNYAALLCGSNSLEKYVGTNKEKSEGGAEIKN
jgi:hypothetical protein